MHRVQHKRDEKNLTLTRDQARLNVLKLDARRSLKPGFQARK